MQSAADPLIRTHLRWGWAALFVFATTGVGLEGLHAFKVGWYLNVGEETRRLMWTLGHAHGTLLGLVHVAFAATLGLAPEFASARRALASRALRLATLLLPSGFYVGGIWPYAGDPGLAIVFLPVGSVLLCVALAAAIPPRVSNEPSLQNPLSHNAGGRGLG